MVEHYPQILASEEKATTTNNSIFYSCLSVVVAVFHLGHAAQKRSVSRRMARGDSIENLAREMNLGERCSFKEGETARSVLPLPSRGLLSSLSSSSLSSTSCCICACCF